VRGALEPLPGVRKVDVTVGKREFTVTYEPSKVSTAKMLQELERAGEGAKVQT
jgi:copper chaperone CopZ